MTVNTRVFYREISNVGTADDRESAPRTATDRKLLFRGDADSRVPTHVFIQSRAL